LREDTQLTAPTTDRNLFVDDVVTALTGVVGMGRGNAATLLKDQMQRAAEEFDRRTAEAFARALLESLCTDQLDLRRLEALLILGLAHPTILEKHRISLHTEGQRLATMLQNQGQHERARVLLETIELRGPDEEKRFIDFSKEQQRSKPSNADELIERYLRKADECASHGRSSEAIHWLQEVVLLDRNRRDVARMIRDLRYQEKERRVRNARRVKLGGLLLVLAGAAAGLVWREQSISERYQSIPLANEGDASAMRLRLEEIHALVAENRVWFGMAEPLREESRLSKALGALESTALQTKHEAALERSRELEVRDGAYSRGMVLAEQGKFEAALADLKHALELSPPGWEHEATVRANVLAIENWLRQQSH
jgi:tetratricopeptide (TPR) repeat protein